MQAASSPQEKPETAEPVFKEAEVVLPATEAKVGDEFMANNYWRLSNDDL